MTTEQLIKFLEKFPSETKVKVYKDVTPENVMTSIDLADLEESDLFYRKSTKTLIIE